MSDKRAVILMQFKENKLDFDFSSQLGAIVKQKTGQNDTAFSLDNHSDAVTVHYAIKLIDESDQSILIVESRNATRLGSLLSVLNHAVRKKVNIRLITLGNSELLKPFFKALKGEELINMEDLDFN